MPSHTASREIAETALATRSPGCRQRAERRTEGQWIHFLVQCRYSECVEVDLGAGVTNQCCSLPGEQCKSIDSTATIPAQGTCCSGADLCPVAGGVGTPNVCCTASGEITPHPIDSCGEGGNTGQGCCTGQCNVAEDVCCAPADTDPTLSGGVLCTGSGPNFSCCSGNCSATPGLCA